MLRDVWVLFIEEVATTDELFEFASLSGWGGAIPISGDYWFEEVGTLRALAVKQL